MPKTDTPRPSIDSFDKVTIKKKVYYEKKDIEAAIYIGYRTINNFIAFNKLEEHEYIRAHLENGRWVPGTFPYNSRDDKLFVSVDAALEIVHLDDVRHKSKRIKPSQKKTATRGKTRSGSSKSSKKSVREISESGDETYVNNEETDEREEDEDLDVVIGNAAEENLRNRLCQKVGSKKHLIFSA